MAEKTSNLVLLPPAPGSQDVVDVLEAMLERARRGEVLAICLLEAGA